MSIPKFPDAKDPDDVADFVISFSGAMVPGDAIASINLVQIVPSNTVDPPPSSAPDLQVGAQLFSGQDATLWLTGGKAGWRYEVGVVLTTTGGRILHRRALLTIKNL